MVGKEAFFFGVYVFLYYFFCCDVFCRGCFWNYLLLCNTSFAVLRFVVVVFENYLLSNARLGGLLIEANWELFASLTLFMTSS